MTTAVEQTATAVNDTVTELSALRRGARARICSISTARGTGLARRLVDLGLDPGRTIEVIRRAPLGDPTIYRVADYELGLRRQEADLVLVEVVA
ncbi:MAG: FeoA family protein [Actinomyces sp.]|uniref:FeoA family protein n=1 Tax=Actinomyces sp. TaxID=29317 RepID=UPI0026DD951F|nr:FeoA family protein [Actinomyces sp.]MDO4243848.1 FeoA family protein [Actinomyces sp.]